MPGSKVKPRSLKIIALHKKGLKVWQIAKEVDAKASLVVAAIRRAQLRGDLPPATPKPITSLSGLKRIYQIKVGAVGSVLEAQASPDVWEFVAEQTIAGGYNTMAEYVVDLITDAYYEQKGTTDD